MEQISLAYVSDLLDFLRGLHFFWKTLILAGWIALGWAALWGAWTPRGEEEKPTVTAPQNAPNSTQPINAPLLAPDSTQINAPINAPNAPGGTQTIAPGATIHNTIERDVLKGTKFTRRELEDMLPFGYTLYFHDGEKLRWSVNQVGNSRWEADWENVDIHPDFGNRELKLEIPQVCLYLGIDGPAAADTTVKATGSTIAWKFPLVVGLPMPLLMFWLGADTPIVHTAILSDNQRAWVVAIGLRKPDAETIKRFEQPSTPSMHRNRRQPNPPRP